MDTHASYQPMPAPLRGLGAGFCLSRVFVRQFGGDLVLSSEGAMRGALAEYSLPIDPDIPERPLEES